MFYQITPQSGLMLNELHRGDPQPPPNQLHLNRKLWLDTDGTGLSIQDQLRDNFINHGALVAPTHPI